MKLSHSKLSCILSCPMTYYLNYVCGISFRKERPALTIGSAFHYGAEHGIEDLTEWFSENGTFAQQHGYSYEQRLSEAMCHGYLKNKDKIFEDILTDKTTGEKATLLDECHELYITAKLPSNCDPRGYNDFVGIIDLLLLTDKGFIVIDYKTSSSRPDWNNYLDQIYRYIFLLRSEFPEVPIYKIGIINVRKSQIRQKKAENDSQFLNRLMFEYEGNVDDLVNYHEYDVAALDKTLVDSYIANLTAMGDTAYTIDKERLFYINYGNLVNAYGKSDYYDIIYHTPDAYLLYTISDTIWNESTNQFDSSRECVPLDMLAIDFVPIMNKYSKFKTEYNESNIEDKQQLFELIKTKYEVDDSLLETYWTTLVKEKEGETHASS